MNALLELAERCEKATGPDAYDDLDIHKAVNPDMAEMFTLTDAPAYTASLDAAITLVPPDGKEPWDLAYEAPGVWIADFTCFASRDDNGLESSFYVRAATPALALCAAALRARAAQ